MLRRCILISMLLAATTGAADDVPAGEAMASAAAVTPAPGASDAMASAGKPEAAEAPAKAAAAKPAKGAAPTAVSESGDAGGDKALSGMSILGNQEAPKSLVIVPWKSSEMGDTLGLDDHLDDGRRPVDRQVFMRELSYYEIRSGSK